MKIALAQLNFQIGNLIDNERKMIVAIQEAKQKDAQLIVFPEMAIGGYPAKDLLLSPDFIKSCQKSLENLAKHCESISCIVGLPTFNTAKKGKSLRNSAAYISDGQIMGFVHKSLIPDYDVFDEYRYFEPCDQVNCIEIEGCKIALTICEDLWDAETPSMYQKGPMDTLKSQDPDLLINIAASPFAQGQLTKRLNVLKYHAQHLVRPLLYVNQIGAQADLIFDGHSLVMDAQGIVLDVLPGFQESVHFYQFEKEGIVSFQDTSELKFPSDSMETVYHALTFGIRDYFDKMNFKSAVIGLSGGLDSALVAALACAALGPERVYAILMPSKYSSDHSIQDALALVENTGCHSIIVPIEECASAFEKTLSVAFQGEPASLTEENIQARIRGTMLMAFSNQYGHILLNTSNKSEAAVGYGTLYGDMAGSLSVIGDVFKTDAYRIAHYINRKKEIIPVHILVKPPSAELRPDQKDSDSLPDYAVLDPILRLYIEEGWDESAIVSSGHDEKVVQRALRLVDQSEFKRFQSPPVLRISKKAFGPGRSYSLVSKNNFCFFKPYGLYRV